MTKRMTVVMLVVLVLLSSSLSSLWAQGQTEAGTAKPIVIKATQENAPTHPVGIGFDKFKEILERESGGAFEVKVYHSASLGSQREMIEGTQLNTIQIAAVPCGYMANFSPIHDIFSMPFLFRDVDHFNKVLEGPIMNEFEGSLKEIDLYALGYSTSGYRQIYATKPIEKVADLKGLTIRVMEVETIVDTLEALGAKPVPLGFGEVYTALQTGTVDGGETSIISWYSSSHHEVAPYLAKVNYMDSGRVYFASSAFMDTLTADQRKMIENAMAQAIDEINNLYEEQQKNIEENVVPTLAKVRITHPDLDEFIEATRVVYEKNPPALGMEWIDIIRNTR